MRENGGPNRIMTNAKKTVRSAIWSMVEAGGASGLQFITLIIMARLLAPAEFGLAALTYSVISLMAIMVSGLFNEAIIQRRDCTPQSALRPRNIACRA